MTFWIKRCARMMATGSFFIAFFLGMDPNDPFDKNMLIVAVLKGCAAAFLFWAAGFVLADIVIKGMVSDISTDEKDALEGGVLGRLYGMQAGMAPETQPRAVSEAAPLAASKNKALLKTP